MDQATEPVAESKANTNPIVLLTRDAHATSRWLVDLERSLVQRGAVVLIMPLSSFDSVNSKWRCLVNRVSDAASPTEVKQTMAALRSAELHGIPTVNGLACYAIGTSKLLHHELFDVVGVASPRYIQIKSDTSTEAALAQVTKADLCYPLLAKPNSGGFGAGIASVGTPEDLTLAILASARGEDGVALLQEYIKPADGNVYRVFFLRDVIQRCVCVRATELDGFNACVCSTKFALWEAPEDVSESVKSMARVAGADCGSVELLYNEKNGRALYFDFNLLSTLPDASSYDELAEMVCQCC